jgi:hypothetical protein
MDIPEFNMVNNENLQKLQQTKDQPQGIVVLNFTTLGRQANFDLDLFLICQTEAAVCVW